MRRPVFVWALGALAGCSQSGGGLRAPDGGSVPDLVAPPGDLSAPAADLAPAPPDLVPSAGDLAGVKPLEGPMGTWTWIDFPESSCDDGSPTGIAINPGPSKDLLVLLTTAGGCWDYTTCFTLRTAVGGPWGKAQFQQIAGNFAGSIVDRNAANPLRDWSFVLVPNCSGDFHLGKNAPTYMGGGPAKVYRHAGRANLEAYVPRIAATWGGAGRVLLAGISGGGLGAFFNYDLVRRAFPASRMYLVDDSMPPLVGDDAPKSLRDAWYASWGLGATFDGFCPACRNDLAAIVAAIAAQHPNDRVALLSSQQDQPNRSIFGLTPAQYEMAVERLAGLVIDKQPKMRVFIVAGSTHTTLLTPEKFTSRGVKLVDWLRQMVSDDPAWASQRP